MDLRSTRQSPPHIHHLRRQDFLHSITSSTAPTSFESTLPESTKIRLVSELIMTNTLQGEKPLFTSIGLSYRRFWSVLGIGVDFDCVALVGGLGVTPGSGGWRRVEGIVGLHDEVVSCALVVPCNHAHELIPPNLVYFFSPPRRLSSFRIYFILIPWTTRSVSSCHGYRTSTGQPRLDPNLVD